MKLSIYRLKIKFILIFPHYSKLELNLPFYFDFLEFLYLIATNFKKTIMAGISMLNPKAEVARAAQALAVNISAAKGIQDVLKTNLGPKGTMKMLVSGAGDIKITKDGNILLHEMQIQHPTASLIARASTAQVSICIYLIRRFCIIIINFV